MPITKKKSFWVSIICITSAIIIAISVVLAIIAYENRLERIFGKYNVDSVKTLPFKEGSDEFRILQLTDTHIKDVKQLDYMRESIAELVKHSQPDFIIITGDSIWKGQTKSVLKKYVAVMDSFKIPFSLVFGNHDLEGDATVADFVEAYNNSEYGFLDVGPAYATGNSNYQINLKSNNKIVYSLMFLDSLAWNKIDGEVKTYDWIRNNQVDYYEWCIKGVSESVYGSYNPKENKVIPSLMFFHIPQQEFWDSRVEMLEKYGLNTPAQDGSIATDTDNNVATDERLYPRIRSSIVSKAVKLQSTKAMFVGHLHKDRSHYNYNGLQLVQGLKTLTTSSFYGCLPEETKIEVGGTLITVKTDGSFSWDRIYSTIFDQPFVRN